MKNEDVGVDVSDFRSFNTRQKISHKGLIGSIITIQYI